LRKKQGERGDCAGRRAAKKARCSYGPVRRRMPLEKIEGTEVAGVVDHAEAKRGHLCHPFDLAAGRTEREALPSSLRLCVVLLALPPSLVRSKESFWGRAGRAGNCHMGVGEDEGMSRVRRPLWLHWLLSLKKRDLSEKDVGRSEVGPGNVWSSCCRKSETG